jgi:putative ATP-binding cassette transporter
MIPESGPRLMTPRAALRRFWSTARGFWHGPTAWALIAMLVGCVSLQLFVPYRLNFWNRDFFNALEARDGRLIWQEARLLLALAAVSVTLGIVAVWGRMTFQRCWRDWLTRLLINEWLADQRINVSAS